MWFSANLPAVIILELSPWLFSLVFQEKQEKQKLFRKSGNITGQKIRNASHSHLRKKNQESQEERKIRGRKYTQQEIKQDGRQVIRYYWPKKNHEEVPLYRCCIGHFAVVPLSRWFPTGLLVWYYDTWYYIILHVCVCCLHMKPFFLSNSISTSSVLPNSSP